MTVLLLDRRADVRAVPSAAVELRILGALEVRDGSTVVPVRRGLPRAVLAWLAVAAPGAVSPEVLIDRLWGDDLPSNPANALQTQISYLRRVLAESIPGAEHVLVTQPSGYSLDVTGDAIDARRFEHAFVDARRMLESEPRRSREALEAIESALALWRGEPLPEVASHPAARGEITRLEELRVAARETQVDLLLELGRHGDAVGELGQLVATHPLHERFHAQLMLALYRCGRQGEALRAFEIARQQLIEQLGLDAGPDLRALERRILSQDPDLDWHAPPAALTPPDLHTAAPPTVPARPRRRTAALPTPVTSLIGREAEIVRLVELLGRTRLLTLTGPGGAGKTRLAIEVAARLAASEGTQVLFVDLAGVDSDDDVALAVAAAIDVPTAPGDDVERAVADAIDQELCLVLDTCEHVVHGVAGLAATILHADAGVRVLATSRRPLAVVGELAWPVPPLPLPAPDAPQAAAESAAVQLFRERAAAVRPDFELSDANAADVVAICLALDGLPLAIELAAAHSDVLSPGAIRARLVDRFGLLVGDTRDAAQRQRTLRAAIDWSAQLLGEEERTFLARLAVFAGPFGLDAAAAVTDTQDALPLLRALVRQSLVVVAGDDRFRLLDSLRAYATELLAADAGELRRTRNRHATFYARVADLADRAVRGPDQPRVVEVVAGEAANLRAALEWSFTGGEVATGVLLAASLAWFWTSNGQLTEGDRWMRAATETEAAPLRVRARALLGAAMVAAPMGDIPRTRDLCAAAVDMARRSAAPGVLGGALLNLGNAHWALGDLAAATASQDAAIEHYRGTGSDWGVGASCTLRARTALDGGDDDRAAALLEEAGRAVAKAGDRHLEALLLLQQAQLALVRGDLSAAAAIADAALEVNERIGYLEGVVTALCTVADVRWRSGDAGGAAVLHRRSLAMAVDRGLPGAALAAVEAMAAADAAAGDTERARRLLSAAREERTARGLPAVGARATRLAALEAQVGGVADAEPFDVVVGELLREV